MFSPYYWLLESTAGNGNPDPIGCFLSEYKPSYEWSTKLSLIDPVLGVSS